MNRPMLVWGIGGALGGGTCSLLCSLLAKEPLYLGTGLLCIVVSLFLIHRALKAASCRVVIDDQGLECDQRRVAWSAVRRVVEKTSKPGPFLTIRSLSLKCEGPSLWLSDEAFTPEQFATLRQLVADRCTIETPHRRP